MSGTIYPEYIGDVSGSYNKITRSIFKRSGDIDRYGGLFFVSGNDNLIEDVAEMAPAVTASHGVIHFIDPTHHLAADGRPHGLFELEPAEGDLCQLWQ